MAGEAYFTLPSWSAATEAIKQDLLAPASALVRDRTSDLQGATIGRPVSYGGRYPWWMLFFFQTRGQCEWAERYMPAACMAQIVIVAPATNPASNPGQSGRAHVEIITENAFGEYIDRLWDLGTVRDRASGQVAVQGTTTGAEDEFGRAMFWDTQGNVLWAHSADLVVTL